MESDYQGKEKQKNIKEFLNEVEAKIGKANEAFLSFLNKHNTVVFLAIVSIFGLLVRIFLFNFVSEDYTDFLSGWYREYYESGIGALGRQIGDYSPAYNYLLYIISWFKYDPDKTYYIGSLAYDPVLWSIKIYSVIFDFGNAIFVYLIVKNVTENKTKALIAYALTLFGITAILNSAYWGQCDSIYCFFILGSIYFLLKEKQHLAFIFYSLAFCFKLQSLFILPVFLLLYLKKNVKLRCFLYIPLVYLLVALPACIAAGGRFFNRLGEILQVYFNQAGSNHNISNNAGTFYSLFIDNYTGTDALGNFALVFGLAVNFLIFFFTWRSKAEFKKETIVKIFLVSMLTMPYFLPHMHERYFYLADIFVMVYVVLSPKKFWIAILVLLNSLTGYMIYLWSTPLLGGEHQHYDVPGGMNSVSLRFSSALLLVALIFVLYDLFSELKEPTETIDIKE